MAIQTWSMVIFYILWCIKLECSRLANNSNIVYFKLSVLDQELTQLIGAPLCLPSPKILDMGLNAYQGLTLQFIKPENTYRGGKLQCSLPPNLRILFCPKSKKKYFQFKNVPLLTSQYKEVNSTEPSLSLRIP